FADDAIQNLDRIVRMTADRVEGGKLELLPLFPRNDDQLGHRDARKTAHSMLRGRPTRVKPPGCQLRALTQETRRPATHPPCVAERLVAEPDPRRDRGGIGRRAGLRCQWVTPWGFESPRSHQGFRRLERDAEAFLSLRE